MKPNGDDMKERRDFSFCCDFDCREGGGCCKNLITW